MLSRYEKSLRRGLHGLDRAGRLLSSDPPSSLLVLRMSVWIVAVSLLVKVLPLPRILQLMTPLFSRPSIPAHEAAQQRLARLIDSVLSMNVWVFTPTCWKRAAVLYRYLALSGVQTRVVFGVRRKDEGLLAGHAWLETSGQPILEAAAPDYTVTYSFPNCPLSQ